MKKTSRRGIDVDVEELDRLIDSTEQGPLSEADRRRLKTAVHAMGLPCAHTRYFRCSPTGCS